MSSKVKFMYDDIPLEGAIAPAGDPVPVPKVNTETIAQLQEQIKAEEHFNKYRDIEDVSGPNANYGV